MLPGCCAGIFAEDVAEIGGGGEATGCGDVFEFAVRGAEQIGGGFDAAALQPVVGAHAGFTFEVGKKSRTAGAGMICESVHGERNGKVAVNEVDEIGGHLEASHIIHNWRHPKNKALLILASSKMETFKRTQRM